MTMATIFAAYFTMFIMTYLGLYVYHRVQATKTYRYHDADFMARKRMDMITQSLGWPFTLIVATFIGFIKGAQYVGNNFFGMLDTIGDKFFNTLPIKKNEDY